MGTDEGSLPELSDGSDSERSRIIGSEIPMHRVEQREDAINLKIDINPEKMNISGDVEVNGKRERMDKSKTRENIKLINAFTPPTGAGNT